MTRRAKEKRNTRVLEKKMALEKVLEEENRLPDGAIFTDKREKQDWLDLLNSIDGPERDFRIPLIVRWKSTSVPIAASSFFQLPIKIDAKLGTISYEFETKDYDIDFTVLVSKMNSEGNALETVVPLERFQSHEKTINGKLSICGPSMVFLKWDNTFSWLNVKEIAYSVELQQSTPMEDERLSCFRAAETMHQCKASLVNDTNKLAQLKKEAIEVNDEIEKITNNIKEMELLLVEKTKQQEEIKESTTMAYKNVRREKWKMTVLCFKLLDSTTIKRIVRFGSLEDINQWQFINKKWFGNIQQCATTDLV